MWREQVLDRVGQVGDRRLSDHPRGALERMRKPEHAGDVLGPSDSLLELERRPAKPFEELASLDAKVLVRVLGHRATGAPAAG